MTQTVTIRQALRRGFWHVNFPVMSMMIIPLGLFVATGVFDAEIHAFVPEVVFDSVRIVLGGLALICIPCAWLWWSFAVPKWKLWAYSRVEDVDQLKQEAIAVGLIWPDGHILEKTEICSKAMRQDILRLEGRL